MEIKRYVPVRFVGLENYKTVLSNTMFLKTLFNTVEYVLFSLIGFVIPIIIAVIMNELVHFRKLSRVVVYFPSVMPAVAVSLLWYFMFYPDETGLLNMLLAKLGMNPYIWLNDGRFTILYIVISMTWSGMGATAIYYFAALQGINRELYEAAVIDGAGFFSRFRVVTLPHMYGIIILFLVRKIILVFNILEQPLQMTDGGPNNASMSLGLLNYRYAFIDNQPQYAMALGVMMFLAMSVLTILYIRINKKMGSEI